MTFGEIVLARGDRSSSWVMSSVAPHVSIKLKRWFKQLDVAASRLRLSATPALSAELAWFLERYPMRMKPEHAAELGRLADVHRDKQAQIQLALSGAYDRPALAMAKPAREYQDQAAQLCDTTGALLVADELGLGKTVTAIALLARAGNLPAVVVVPNNVLEQWPRKIAEFLPRARVHVIRSGPKGETKRDRQARGCADVLVMAYTQLAGWSEILAPQAIVFDECQELRHAGTGKYLAALEIRSRALRCMGLSATPIYGYGGEFYNVIGVLAPGSLGERDEFIREWCSAGGDKPKIADPIAFGAWLRDEGLMLRRSRADVGRELPPLIRTIIDVPMDRGGSDFDVAAELEAIAWAALYGKPKDRFTARGDLDHRLRQWTGVGKAPAVAGLVDELIESTGEAVVLSGWHHAVYDIWREKLARWNPVFYTGKEDSKAKDASARALISGESKLLIMSLRAGQGLDGLQHVCRRVVHGELDWSPQVMQQLTGRLHRDMQTETVMEYWPITDEGSDPVIMDTLGVKRWQSDAVIDPKGERLLEVKADPNAMRVLAETYLRKRGLDPANPPLVVA